jgi:hypothetical protein
VSDLKAELKRRNLPVSGSKPQLIERLRPFSEQMGIQAPAQTSQQQQQLQSQQQTSSQSSSSLQQQSFDQPPTPSSNHSSQHNTEPRSVATLALGEDSLSGELQGNIVITKVNKGGILLIEK